jgi:hypothetical protein
MSRRESEDIGQNNPTSFGGGADRRFDDREAVKVAVQLRLLRAVHPYWGSSARTL